MYRVSIDRMLIYSVNRVSIEMVSIDRVSIHRMSIYIVNREGVNVQCQ